MAQTILTVQHLSVVRDNAPILTDINFTLKKSDVLIILGPNGAGKTTLLKALLNLIPCTGNVTWHTKKISYLPPQEFVRRNDLPPMTVYEFFMLKGTIRSSIEKIIQQVGLTTSILHKQFNALSTGQFQRMLIAWALIDNPEVLLFDEPTSGIDIGGQETIYSLLHTFWKERGLTIILVTHNLDVVWEHATDILCINKKQICYGDPSQILTPENLAKIYGKGTTIYEHRHNQQ
jgi:zinc transport system ATP-binding protein